LHTQLQENDRAKTATEEDIQALVEQQEESESNFLYAQEHFKITLQEENKEKIKEYEEINARLSAELEATRGRIRGAHVDGAALAFINEANVLQARANHIRANYHNMATSLVDSVVSQQLLQGRDIPQLGYESSSSSSSSGSSGNSRNSSPDLRPLKKGKGSD
jgi:hypothetical protein